MKYRRIAFSSPDPKETWSKASRWLHRKKRDVVSICELVERHGRGNVSYESEYDNFGEDNTYVIVVFHRVRA